MPSSQSHARRPNAPHGGTLGLIPRLENLEQRLQPAREWFGISDFSLVAPVVTLGPSQSQPVLVAPITVNRDFRVDDLDVRIDLEFPDLGGLEIRLESPDGTTSIPLTPTSLNLTANGASLDVVLDDEAEYIAPLNFANGIDAGRRYQPPQFQQKQSLSLFDGMEARGDWKVSFRILNPGLAQKGLVKHLALGFTGMGIDDHGDSPGNASSMLFTVADGSTPVLSESGRFDTAADHDFFSLVAPTTGASTVYIRTTEDAEIDTSPFQPIVRDHATGALLEIVPLPGNIPLLEKKIGFMAVTGSRYDIEVSGEAPCEYVVIADFARFPTGVDPEGGKTHPAPLLELGNRGPWTAGGNIDFGGDDDWFSWTAPGSLNISLSATAGQDSKLAPRIEIFDSSGFNLITRTGPNGANGSKSQATLFTVVQGGKSYRVRIRAEDFEPLGQRGGYSILLQESADDNPDSRPLRKDSQLSLPKWFEEGNIETYADSDAFTFTPLTSGSLQLIVKAATITEPSVPLFPAFELFTGEADQVGGTKLLKLEAQNRLPGDAGKPGKRQLAVFQVVAGQTYRLVVSPHELALAENRQGTYRISALLFEDEPNNTKHDALTLLDQSGIYSGNGKINEEGDADMWSWTAPKTMIVELAASSGGTGNLKPMMSMMADSGLFVKGLVNETAARQWSMRFTATRGVRYFMEIKDRGDAGDVTGGTGTYSISVQPLPDEEENRSAPLDDSFKGALSGTIGADDDEDSFVFRPKRSGFLAMTSAAFVEGKASPGFRVENGGATMLVENNRVAVVAGKEYSIVVTAADRSFGTDAIGDYSVGFAGENLSVLLPEIGMAIPKPSPNDLATEIDDSTEQATEPVATLIEEKESDVADDKPTTLEYPVFGARVIVTIGATTRDPLVDLILSSRFGQTLVATSGVDRILPIGTPTAVPFIPEPMARIYRPVVSVAVTIADRLEEDSRKAYAVASSRLNREYSRWFASARYPVAALIPTEPAESGIQAPGNLMPLESASEASSPTRPMLEWAVPLIGSLFLKNWLPIRKTGRNPGLNRWSSNQIKACR